jgi:CheY-like chemotaxis protein
MSADDASKLIESISHLVGALVWPGLVLLLAVRFKTQIGDAVDDVRTTMLRREFSMKAGPGGIELTAGARVATALLEEEEARTGVGTSDPREVEAAVGSAVSVLATQPSTSPVRLAPRILWVDDRPQNNRLVRRAFEELGFIVREATSTDQGLELLERDAFDVVISDMGRPPDARAGYTLLDELRRRGNTVPFVIYAGSKATEHVEEARQHGAIGTTNRPSELIQLVVASLQGSP